MSDGFERSTNQECHYRLARSMILDIQNGNSACCFVFVFFFEIIYEYQVNYYFDGSFQPVFWLMRIDRERREHFCCNDLI